MHNIVTEGPILLLTIGNVILRHEMPKNLGAKLSNYISFSAAALTPPVIASEAWQSNITIRRIRKVTVHCFMSLIIVQAQALHNVMNNQLSFIRQCVFSSV